MKSTLTFSLGALLLVGGVAMPETAWAYKPKSEWRHRVAYNPSDVGHQMMANYGSGVVRWKGRPKQTSFKGGYSLGDGTFFAEMANGLGTLCSVGGLVTTVASVATSAAAVATGPIGWGVGGVCLASQIFGLGAPAPKPTVITFKSPDIRQTIYVDGPSPDNDSARYFMYAPIQSDEKKPVPKPSEEIPMSEAQPAPAPQPTTIPVPAAKQPQVPPVQRITPESGQEEAYLTPTIINLGAGLAKR